MSNNVHRARYGYVIDQQEYLEAGVYGPVYQEIICEDCAQDKERRRKVSTSGVHYILSGGGLAQCARCSRLLAPVLTQYYAEINRQLATDEE